MLRAKGLNADHRHEVSSDQDLLALLEANIGIGFLPRTVNAPQSLVRITVKDSSSGGTSVSTASPADNARRSPQPS